MNSRIAIALSVLTLAFGGFASAASAQDLTRAEVHADLVRVEQAGYNPSIGNDATYPADIQAAEAKIAAQDNQSLANEAMGGTTMSGMSASGSHLPAPSGTSSSCVGPASYCNIFFGS
ncbi:DUF4148 domain-containing protein [Paraburkholderia flagellata]|uniref:DUF4148 domain-containing protein n=1 Tax=Paraburkholderia flagellata TaxID=2883241 RepID=UPI001F38BC92|nr:DUF4148 domain-containing protein [Paraburkholderia flagellata]